jgi:hypothetical protein
MTSSKGSAGFIECFGARPWHGPDCTATAAPTKPSRPPTSRRAIAPARAREDLGFRNLSYLRDEHSQTRAEHEPDPPDAHVQLALVKCEQCRDDTLAVRPQAASFWTMTA